MKSFTLPLIIACLFVTTLHAQSVADAARRERERRATQTIEKRVYTGAPEDARSRISVPTVAPLEADATAAPTSDEATPGSNSTRSEPTSPDPIQELLDEIRDERAIIQDLEDRRVRGLLEVNRLKGAYLAPVTSQSERRQVQSELDAAEGELTEIESTLSATREVLAGLEAALERLPRPDR